MLSNGEFVRQSLELDLFFLRIMKEHSFFLEGGFVPKDHLLAVQADQLKNEFTYLLNEVINLSFGRISPEVASSGEIVTPYTLNAERLTEFYTGIRINTNLTMREQELSGAQEAIKPEVVADEVEALNYRIMYAVQQLINFKGNILQNVLACRLFTFNYPLLIDHIRREAVLFYDMLTRLQNRTEIDMVRFAIEQESFWNRIMAEHAKFIRGLLDPTEETLFETADKFGHEFDQLTAESLAAQQNAAIIPRVTQESLQATRDIRDFKAQGTQGLITCKIKSIILPLLGDHTLREANHFLRLLKMFKMGIHS
ncbi:MAG: DUF2935 domain-containing protein [Dehalobacterium sp.]